MANPSINTVKEKDARLNELAAKMKEALAARGADVDEGALNQAMRETSAEFCFSSCFACTHFILV